MESTAEILGEGLDENQENHEPFRRFCDEKNLWAKSNCILAFGVGLYVRTTAIRAHTHFELSEGRDSKPIHRALP